MGPQFILVTGANASGKTTLIESNRKRLASAGFDIIIPDDILRKTHSLYEGSPVREALDTSINSGRNLVLETPFQLHDMADTVAGIKQLGYHTTLLQLFVGREKNSIIRVQDRARVGGLNIDPAQIAKNYQSNMANVARHFSMFDLSFFIDNSHSDYEKNLVAKFGNGELIFYKRTEIPSIKDFFKMAIETGGITNESAAVLKQNPKAFGSETGVGEKPPLKW